MEAPVSTKHPIPDATPVDATIANTAAGRSRFAMPRMARALRHPNFMLFFLGQSVSLIGTWMTRVATSWLVYRLTGSAMLLGTISFAGQIPTFLLAPMAGVWVDRFDRRKVLLATQFASMLQALALALLTLTGHINIPLLLALSCLQGIINACDMPARQSFLIQMVDDRTDLSNAIAINSSMVNVTRLIGPSIAGLLIAATSEGWCFLIDGISYVAVLLSLLAMQIHKPTGSRKPASTFKAMAEGWSYVSGYLPIRTILLLFAVCSLMGMPFVVLMPIFAAQVLKGGPHTLGFLMAAMGVGALISALSLAARTTIRGLLGMIPVASLVFGLGLIGFGLSHWFWLSMVMVLIAGMGMMHGMAASNTIIQTITSEDKRGRVMSYYTMAFVGMAPFGALLAGTMAEHLGAPLTVMLNGAAVMVGSLWFFTRLKAVRAAARPVYEELGLIAKQEPLSDVAAHSA